MAQITREVLNADGMSTTIYCAGQSTVGIGISGTWVGTVKFYGSQDGLNFIALTVTPFASGTGVQSTTATGNWFVAVQNFVAIKVTFTRTSGSVTAILAAAVDASWQDAFLSSTTIFASSSVTSGNNTLTQAAQTNRAWNLQFLEVCSSGPGYGANGKVVVYDGGVTGSVLYQETLTSPVGSVGTVQKCNLPVDQNGNPSIVNTPGNAMTIVVYGTGNNATIVNAKFSAG